MTQTRPLADRFWEKVARGESDACWPWLAFKDRKGYGYVSITRSKARVVSRVAYELTHGVTLTKDICVCHRCDNPPCVNPAHLFLGTVQDNNRDMAAKGRVSHHPGRFVGEKNPAAKLNPSIVRRIRKLHASGLSCAEIARQFHVSAGCVEHLIRGLTWTKVA